MTEITEVTYRISKENLEAAIENFLVSMMILPRSVDIISTRLPIKTNKDGTVTITVNILED